MHVGGIREQEGLRLQRVPQRGLQALQLAVCDGDDVVVHRVVKMHAVVVVLEEQPGIDGEQNLFERAKAET